MSIVRAKVGESTRSASWKCRCPWVIWQISTARVRAWKPLRISVERERLPGIHRDHDRVTERPSDVDRRDVGVRAVAEQLIAASQRRKHAGQSGAGIGGGGSASGPEDHPNARPEIGGADSDGDPAVLEISAQRQLAQQPRSGKERVCPDAPAQEHIPRRARVVEEPPDPRAQRSRPPPTVRKGRGNAPVSMARRAEYQSSRRAYVVATTAPMETPTTAAGRSPRASSARKTPTWAKPRAPPPDSTSAKGAGRVEEVISLLRVARGIVKLFGPFRAALSRAQCSSS